MTAFMCPCYPILARPVPDGIGLSWVNAQADPAQSVSWVTATSAGPSIAPAAVSRPAAAENSPWPQRGQGQRALWGVDRGPAAPAAAHPEAAQPSARIAIPAPEHACRYDHKTPATLLLLPLMRSQGQWSRPECAGCLVWEPVSRACGP